MKCPKCEYIGFEPSDRCRNCGYEFSLSRDEVSDPDLPLRGREAIGPMEDLDLGAQAPAGAGRAGVRRRADGGRSEGAGGRARLTPADLPLFEEAAGDDLPIVPSASPTPPLAVRRSTPPVARSRIRPPSRLSESVEDPALPLAERGAPARDTPSDAAAPATGADRVAGLAARASAALVDALLLLGLDAAVVYFTLRLCRLAPTEILVLPAAPLAAFLVLLNGGYLAMLTAGGGQTLGKMAFGLKVVSAAGGPARVGQSLLRALVLMAGTAAAGLGLLPVLFDRERRALHDRVTDTRVIHASAS
jgi:uncharacterized RDD family membrane protein YckC